MADLSSSNIASLQLLSEMLNPSKHDSSDDEDMRPETGASAYTPGSIGLTASKSAAKESVYTKKSTKAIWDDEEVPSSSMFEGDDDDRRPQPHFDISYKQKVTSEDMFLGTTGKNPSSACCENLVVKISLPETKMSEVDLQVKDEILDCRSPKFKLTMPLPHPVDPDSGSAKWDSKNSVLEVTLVLRREYDFINFQS